ncbi:origin recognition complex subunit 1 isoform X2 [Linepithema humile]
MEQCFQANKEIDELQKLQLRKHCKVTDKYQNVSAKVVTSFREKKKHESNNTDLLSKNNIDPISADKLKNEEQIQTNVLESEHILHQKKHATPVKKVIKSVNNNTDRQKRTNKHKSQQKLQPKIPSESNILHRSNNIQNDVDGQSTVKYRNQGIQTLDTDVESIYSDGVIRYPSKYITKHDETANNGDLNRQKEKASKKQSDSPTDRGDMRSLEDTQKVDLQNSVSPAKDEIDYVKLNKERISVASKLATQLNNGVPPPNYRKGVVPRYLRERKEAQEKEQKARAEALNVDCPEGHVSLPDNERKETLRLLKKNYQDYVNELNMMPIKTDTLRAQRRKMEIEKQLNKLEEGIKVFSRPKVYVKINA